MRALARTGTAVILGLCLAGCHDSTTVGPTGAAVGKTSQPAHKTYGYFTAEVGADADTRRAELLLTVDGEARVYIGAGTSESASFQFVGTIDWDEDMGAGAGMLLGEGCVVASPGPFCDSARLAEIELERSQTGEWMGELSVPESDLTWSIQTIWSAPDYKRPATLAGISGLYEEWLAQFAQVGETVVRVDDSGALFFQSTVSGCIGNGNLVPYASGALNVYGVDLSIAGCSAEYDFFNASDYQGLATTCDECWGNWLVIMVSTGSRAVTMWGSPI